MTVTKEFEQKPEARRLQCELVGDELLRPLTSEGLR